MKTKKLAAVSLIVLALNQSIFATEMMQDNDHRKSLGIKGSAQGIHQLSNMREHMIALRDVVKYTRAFS